MQKIAGYLRRAIEQYNMIQNGDHIAVGVSGGKDSVVLLAGLVKVRSFMGIDFKLTAITLDMGITGQPMDFAKIAALCESFGIDYIVKKTDIGKVVFEIRQEKNPCSLCARMRHGALHDAAIEAGCNKIALGHNNDDAIETFLMNLYIEGRIGCFSPVSYLSRKNITMIRPLVFAPEKDIIHAVRAEGLPIVKNSCPIDGKTQRQHMKEFIKQTEKNSRGFKKRIFGAITRANINGW